MDVNIQLTEDDYVKANFLQMRPRPTFKWAGYFILLLAVIALGFSGFDAVVHQKQLIPFICLAASLAWMAVVFGVTYPKRLKKIFQQQKLLHKPFSFTITDEAILSKAEHGQANLSWDIFRKWKESKELFLLYQSDILFHIVPKRSFASEEDLVQFRKLLIEKIGPPPP